MHCREGLRWVDERRKKIFKKIEILSGVWEVFLRRVTSRKDRKNSSCYQQIGRVCYHSRRCKQHLDRSTINNKGALRVCVRSTKDVWLRMDLGVKSSVKNMFEILSGWLISSYILRRLATKSKKDGGHGPSLENGNRLIMSVWSLKHDPSIK